MFSLRWTRFHRFVIFGPTESFRSNRSIPLGATDFTTGKTVCHIFYVSSDPAPLNESCPLQASHFYHCFVLCLKDQTHSTDSRRPFLEIDVKGGEREHQSLSFEERESIKAYHLHLLKGERDLLGGETLKGKREISRGREYLSRKYFSRIPDAWCSRGEMSTCLLEGRDMFIWSVVLILH